MNKGVLRKSLPLLLIVFVMGGCHGHSGGSTSGDLEIEPPGGGSAPQPSDIKTDMNATINAGGPYGGDLAAASTVGLNPVYFDYDRSDIRQDQIPTLQEDAAWLRQNAKAQVTIEGHCDERGTEEYNLALGATRAGATREYLIRLGVDPARLGTISYGENHPFADGHNEEAWRQNRRAQLATLPPR